MLQKFVKSVSSGGGSSSRAPALSCIAPDVRIIGDIMTEGEIHIDGQVDGDITCTTLVVGEGARIAGEVSAQHVKVHGELTGKINSAVVIIARSARVIGDVTHESLEIEAGAYVEGHCLHKQAASEPKRIEPPQEAKPAKAEEPAKTEPAAPAKAAEHHAHPAKTAEHHSQGKGGAHHATQPKSADTYALNGG